MVEEKVKLTKEGVAQLLEEYRHLIDVERPDVIEQLQAARAQGDLSENADYDAARNRQAAIEARIAEIEHTLDAHEVIEENKDKNYIGIGNEIRLRRVADGSEVVVRMVGSIETDVSGEVKFISEESAIGKAIKGKTKGQKVLVESVRPYEVEILDFYIPER
ncbi:MAG: transcription elongation factor GreA [Bacilli bacterium]|nr:transcription elongation factor GreA [Bacilli bacterium]